MDPDLFAQRRVGTTLGGKWTLERLLGVGGMAAVYVGVHKIGRREAIKILHPEIARSPELRARFEQEAHAVNRFKHPGVVAIRDIDVAEDGTPFLVMELLEGESLADRAQRLGGVESGEMLRLVDELLDVLVAAHAQEIVHRDIKLDNLFVQKDGRLKVLDFGIARVRDGLRSLHTRTGAALGTTPYMAPEQIRGIGVDARVDLFAVGATMFRLVAKRRIHEAATESMLLVKMATQPAPPLASAAPGTPPGICLVVDRALQFERDQRYPDAATMQRDVQALRNELAPPYASTAAGELGAPLREERTAAAAPLARSSQGDQGPASAGPSPSAPHASASWHGAMEATQLAPAPASAVTSPTADPPSASTFVPPGYAGPSSFAQPSAVPASLAVQRKAEDRTWVAILLALFGASLFLLVVLALMHGFGKGAEERPSAAAAKGTASGAASAPAAVDPDDPAWQPSSSKRPPAKPGATPPVRRKHGNDD